MATSDPSMSNEERLQRTIRLEKTDKILSGPAISNFVATYTGLSLKDTLFDEEKAEAAYERTFEELGGWDIISAGPNSAAAVSTNWLRAKLPGRELSDNAMFQFAEEEVMRPEDYDFLIANGFTALMDQLYWRCHPDQTPEDKARLMAEAGRRAKAHTEKWKARGLAQLLGGVSLRAFARFSYARTMPKFAMDLRRMPDKVKEAIKVSQPDIIAEMKKGVAMSGCTRVFVGGSRDSATFLSPKQFEEFCLTDLMEIVYAMTDDGIDIVFHLDNDWTAFLPYFKDCPKGRCLMQLDGSTDIFKAKEILGDHMALMGDVPPSLLALGTPEQVYAYCKKLIDVVGEGGGFILNSGCETPFNAKPENVAAMVRAGNELTWN